GIGHAEGEGARKAAGAAAAADRLGQEAMSVLTGIRVLGVAGDDEAVVADGDGVADGAAAAGAAERQRDVSRVPAAEGEPEGSAAVAAIAADRLGQDAICEIAGGADDCGACRRDV